MRPGWQVRHLSGRPTLIDDAGSYWWVEGGELWVDSLRAGVRRVTAGPRSEEVRAALAAAPPEALRLRGQIGGYAPGAPGWLPRATLPNADGARVLLLTHAGAQVEDAVARGADGLHRLVATPLACVAGWRHAAPCDPHD